MEKSKTEEEERRAADEDIYDFEDDDECICYECEYIKYWQF